VVAFVWRQGNAWAVVVASRLAAGLLGDDEEGSGLPLIDPEKWADTAVEMPPDLAARALFDWLSPAAPKVDENGLLYLRDALAAMPIAVLVEDGVPRS
jgi:(1->4)-alpha-D-glucan 1-alpha-D-glucosylmutase